MKDLIQCKISRDDFQRWLNWGNGPITVYSGESAATMLFKLEKRPNVDYQYLYQIAVAQDNSIFWNDGPVFCGVHDIKNQALYLVGHLAAPLMDGKVPLVVKTSPSIVKEICGRVSQRVEEVIGNDRNNLPIQALDSWRASRDLQDYQEYGAKDEAIQCLFDGREPDGRFRCGYALEELPEAAFLTYIQDPEGFIRVEAERYIKVNQEEFLLQFLKNEALATEYGSLVQDTASPLHRMRAITEGVKACGGKTVSVTILKDGKELTFKTDADALKGCRNSYSTRDIPAADRRLFYEAFGRGATYGAAEITKITFGRKTIYEAPPVQTEDMVEGIRMGGISL